MKALSCSCLSCSYLSGSCPSCSYLSGSCPLCSYLSGSCPLCSYLSGSCPLCSYLSGSCPLFEGRSDYTCHMACVQVYRSGGDTGMHMYSYKYPLSHHTWRSVSSRDCLIRTFSTCGREEHVQSLQTWPNYRSLSEKYIYHNLSKIGPPPFLNEVIAKGAFLSLVCPLIYAAVHAVMLSKKHQEAARTQTCTIAVIA